MTQALRCGLMGIGMMGRNHSRVIREISGVELVVIADQDGDRHNAAQGVPVVSSVHEALKYDLDCAIIAVPTRHHEAVALECAKAKVPTLIEKPLADSVESALRIVSAFSDAKVVGAVGHIERYNPAVQEATKRIKAGDLGEVFQIATRRQSSFPGRISDVGVVKDLATHDIDLVHSLSGSRYKEISASTSHRSGRDTEDMMLALGSLENGTMVSHVVNWLSPLKERVAVITGENGIFTVDTLTGDLTFHRNGEFDIDWASLTNFRGVSEGDVTRFAFPKKEPLKSELIEFFERVNGNVDASIVTFQEGLEVVGLAEAIILAAETGARIRNPQLPEKKVLG